MNIFPDIMKIASMNAWVHFYNQRDIEMNQLHQSFAEQYDELLCKRFNINNIHDMECIICNTKLAPRYKNNNNHQHPIGCCNAIICILCAHKNLTNKCYHCRQENRWNAIDELYSVEHKWIPESDRWIFIERYTSGYIGLNFMQGNDYQDFKENFCKIDKSLSEFYHTMKNINYLYTEMNELEFIDNIIGVWLENR